MKFRDLLNIAIKACLALSLLTAYPAMANSNPLLVVENCSYATQRDGFEEEDAFRFELGPDNQVVTRGRVVLKCKMPWGTLTFRIESRTEAEPLPVFTFSYSAWINKTALGQTPSKELRQVLSKISYGIFNTTRETSEVIGGMEVGTLEQFPGVLDVPKVLTSLSISESALGPLTEILSLPGAYPSESPSQAIGQKRGNLGELNPIGATKTLRTGIQQTVSSQSNQNGCKILFASKNEDYMTPISSSDVRKIETKDKYVFLCFSGLEHYTYEFSTVKVQSKIDSISVQIQGSQSFILNHFYEASTRENLGYMPPLLFRGSLKAYNAPTRVTLNTLDSRPIFNLRFPYNGYQDRLRKLPDISAKDAKIGLYEFVHYLSSLGSSAQILRDMLNATEGSWETDPAAILSSNSTSTSSTSTSTSTSSTSTSSAASYTAGPSVLEGYDRVFELPSQVQDGTYSLNKTIKKVHYFIFAFNLDVVPSIIRQKKTEKSGISDLDIHVTIIHPTKPAESSSKTVDRIVDAAYRDLLKKHQIQTDEVLQGQLSVQSNDKELRIFVGETIDCGSTSSITRSFTKGGGLNFNTALTQYHLNHLKWIKTRVQPNIIISENHTFADEVRSEIDRVLNHGTGPKYQIGYEKIDHAAYSQEARTRLYLVAFRTSPHSTLIRTGYPKIEAVDPFFSAPHIKSKETFSLEKEGLFRPEFSEKSKTLLNLILGHFAAALQGKESGFSLLPYQNKLTLFFQGKPYWLSISKNESWGLPRDGLVFFNHMTGGIRIVNRSTYISQDEPWTLTRFASDFQNRTWGTITGLDKDGVRIWGLPENDRHLNLYELSRVHGCSKEASSVLCKALEKRNKGTSASYLSHHYSNSVLSRVLIASIYKALLQGQYPTVDYPTLPHGLDSKDPDAILPALSLRSLPGTRLAFDQATGTIQLVNEAGNRIYDSVHFQVIDRMEQTLSRLDEENEAFHLDETHTPIPNLLDPTNQAIRNTQLEQVLATLPNGHLYPHQVQGINWLFGQRFSGKGGGILADEMGVGKTRQTALYAYFLDQLAQFHPDLMTLPVLYVVPKNLVDTWKEEFSKYPEQFQNRVQYFAKSTDFQYSKFIERQSSESTRASVLVFTKETLVSCIGELENLHFDTVFIDEAHKMKSPASELSKAMKRLRSGYRYCLSGTPVENDPSDLWNLMDFIQPGHIPKQKEFNLNLLATQVSPYILRRTKKDAAALLGRTLGKKTHYRIGVKYTPLQERMYRALDRFDLPEIAKLGYSAQIWDDPSILNEKIMNEMKQHLTTAELDELKTFRSPKIEALKELISTKFPGGFVPEIHDPIVVISRYNEILDRIKERIGVESAIINGETTQRGDNARIFARFAKKEIPVLLLQLQSATGLNLQTATTAVLFEPWWNPQLESQAEDRIHRITQTKDVEIYRFITPDTLESKQVAEIQEQKKRLFKTLIESTPQPLAPPPVVQYEFLLPPPAEGTSNEATPYMPPLFEEDGMNIPDEAYREVDSWFQ